MSRMTMRSCECTCSMWCGAPSSPRWRSSCEEGRVITATRAYACADERRRAALQKHDKLMGIDFLEVSADQRSLFLHFVPATSGVTKPVVPSGLTAANIRITGGVRITLIVVVGDPVELP